MVRKNEQKDVITFLQKLEKVESVQTYAKGNSI